VSAIKIYQTATNRLVNGLRNCIVYYGALLCTQGRRATIRAPTLEQVVTAPYHFPKRVHSSQSIRYLFARLIKSYDYRFVDVSGL